MIPHASLTKLLYTRAKTSQGFFVHFLHLNVNSPRNISAYMEKAWIPIPKLGNICKNTL